MSKSETRTGRSLKRLVSRLAYCIRHDAHWYFISPYGLRRHLVSVLESVAGIGTHIVGLAVALFILFFRPFVSPLHWIWHATVNGAKVDTLMESKAANKADERRATGGDA
jgi:hypothetical protein